MTDKKKNVSKDDTYNKKRKPLFRVEIVPSDDAKLLEKIKANMDLLGTPKEALIKMHTELEKQGFFDK